MKLFSQLFEEEQSKKGTYASLKMSEESQAKLHEWVEQLDLEDTIDQSEYHCTITYSRVVVPGLADVDANLPAKAIVKGWDVFGDDKILVAKLECQEAHNLFEKAKELGATYDFPEYVPHVSVALHYKGEAPSTKPDFVLEFDEFKVDELDLESSYEQKLDDDSN